MIVESSTRTGRTLASHPLSGLVSVYRDETTDTQFILRVAQPTSVFTFLCAESVVEHRCTAASATERDAAVTRLAGIMAVVT